MILLNLPELRLNLRKVFLFKNMYTYNDKSLQQNGEK